MAYGAFGGELDRLESCDLDCEALLSLLIELLIVRLIDFVMHDS